MGTGKGAWGGEKGREREGGEGGEGGGKVRGSVWCMQSINAGCFVIPSAPGGEFPPPPPPPVPPS